MVVFSTEGFVKQLHSRSFSRKDFLDKAAANGADAIEVDARFFNERAMYWTRMFRAEADERKICLAAIVCDCELSTTNTYILQASQADISEWIRITALSGIPVLKIRINGVGADAPRDVRSLQTALAPLVVLAERYGTMLTLCDGSSDIGDETLLALAKALGYTAVRIAPHKQLASADAMWSA